MPVIVGVFHNDQIGKGSPAGRGEWFLTSNLSFPSRLDLPRELWQRYGPIPIFNRDEKVLAWSRRPDLSLS